MQLCFFEDEFFQRFHPLTLTRPVDDLRTGIFTMAEKWKKKLNAITVNRLLRDELKDVFDSGRPDASSPCLWINARYLPEPSLIEEVKNLSPGCCLRSRSTVIAAHVDGKTSSDWLEAQKADFNSLFILESSEFSSVTHLWDLFQLNGQQIKNDLDLMESGDSENATVSDHAILENREQIFIGEGATVEAGCIVTARKGPVYIGERATVMAGSVIRGPVAICEDATVKVGAKIYEGTTIGPVCKVGGEVNNCIFHSYSNKGHDGFAGNSIFGQWCNLGADTNTSNLKNNYGTIRVTDWNSGEEVETGQQFLGTVMGDHSKTAINTQLNTGTVCGVSCNIFSNDFPPKFIPSFSWVGSNVIQPYRLDKAFETMEAMMARRDVHLTDSYREMMTYIFKQAHG